MADKILLGDSLLDYRTKINALIDEFNTQGGGSGGGTVEITGAASTIVTENLTHNKVLISGNGGKVEASDVSETELGYLKGLTQDLPTALRNRYYNAEINENVITLYKGNGNNTTLELPTSNIPVPTEETRGGIKIGYADNGKNLGVKVSIDKPYVTLTKEAITSALGFVPTTGEGTAFNIVELSSAESTTEGGTLTDEVYELCTLPNTIIAWSCSTSGGISGVYYFLPYGKLSGSSYRFICFDTYWGRRREIKIDAIMSDHAWSVSWTSLTDGAIIDVTALPKASKTNKTMLYRVHSGDGVKLYSYSPTLEDWFEVGGGSSSSDSGGGIIDVDTLPTDIIDESAIYRLAGDGNVYCTMAGMVNELDGLPISIAKVDTLPDSNKVYVTGDGSFYYLYFQKSDSKIYGYHPSFGWLDTAGIASAFFGTSEYFGGYVSSAEEVVDQEKLYIVIEKAYKLYHYKNGWKELISVDENSGVLKTITVGSMNELGLLLDDKVVEVHLKGYVEVRHSDTITSFKGNPKFGVKYNSESGIGNLEGTFVSDTNVESIYFSFVNGTLLYTGTSYMAFSDPNTVYRKEYEFANIPTDYLEIDEIIVVKR